LERFREGKVGPVLAITCYPESALAQQADFALVALDSFLVWMDDQPGGGGGMYPHQGVAELGGASTRLTPCRLGVIILIDKYFH